LEPPNATYRERRDRRDRELILQLNDLYLQWWTADRIDAPLRKKLARWKELADQLSGEALRRYDVWPWAFTPHEIVLREPDNVISFSGSDDRFALRS
jgi:hypothetical protein